MPHAVVTGAANGIGRTIARTLLDDGWAVTALDTDAGGLSTLDGADTRITDIGAEDEVAAAFQDIAGRGYGTLDLLVNDAGIADPHSGPIEDLAFGEWRRRLATNLDGAFLVTRAAVPLLRRANGSIVTITSTRAAMSEPHSEAYAASKGALGALTHALAISLGPEVRVNAIAPGWIVTEGSEDRDDRRAPGLRDVDHSQHPAGRAGDPRDIADAVLYLARAPFVTGQILTIDGGMTRKMIYEH